ncbi:Endoribonuclease L-PSP (fragment) [Candidatus Promineifilum breve]|uniref:Endoribonuclease L-PSP n=1 Tax=Candidatus Promineifilum breve TaxID=1806508 RepID=A0A170PK55_9CHLR
MKTFRNPADVHAPAGHYVHQVELQGAGRLLVVAGQIGMRPDGSVPDDPLAQLDVAFENVAGNLRAAGMGLSDIIKVTYYHVGRLDRGRRLAVIVKHLGEHKPASTLLYVAGLADPAYLVEVEVWAAM